MFYKSWSSDPYVGFIFTFVPSVRIIAAFFNALGFTHDSQLLEGEGLYNKLEKLHARTGVAIVVNSAFNKSKYPFLDNSAKDETRAETSEEINTIHRANLLHQRAE